MVYIAGTRVIYAAPPHCSLLGFARIRLIKRLCLQHISASNRSTRQPAREFRKPCPINQNTKNEIIIIVIIIAIRARVAWRPGVRARRCRSAAPARVGASSNSSYVNGHLRAQIPTLIYLSKLKISKSHTLRRAGRRGARRGLGRGGRSGRQGWSETHVTAMYSKAVCDQVIAGVTKGSEKVADFLEQLLRQGSGGATLPISYEDLSKALSADGIPVPQLSSKVMQLSTKDVVPQFDQCKNVKEALELIRPMSDVLAQVHVDVKFAAKIFPVLQKICAVEVKVLQLAAGSLTYPERIDAFKVLGPMLKDVVIILRAPDLEGSANLTGINAWRGRVEVHAKAVISGELPKMKLQQENADRQKVDWEKNLKEAPRMNRENAQAIVDETCSLKETVLELNSIIGELKVYSTAFAATAAEVQEVGKLLEEITKTRDKIREQETVRLACLVTGAPALPGGA